MQEVDREHIPIASPMGSACCPLVMAVRAYTLTHHTSAFEVKPLKIWVEIKGRLKNSAMIGVFFRGENKSCCLSDKAMSPLEAAPTRTNPPSLTVRHGGRAQPGVPRLCILSKPAPSPTALPSLYPSPPGHPWPLEVTPTLASRLEKSWGKELQLGTETAAFKPL